MHDLLIDLRSGKGAGKPRGARGAEGASHGAAGLCRGADGEPAARGHAHAFDRYAVRESEKVLPAAVNRHLPRDLLDPAEREALGERLPQGLGKIGHVVEGLGVLRPDPLLDLLGAEGGLTKLGEDLGELPVGERVEITSLRVHIKRSVLLVSRRHFWPLAFVVSRHWSILMREKLHLRV